jgi:ATP-dependent Clp protease ATP-binding subunit ClpA
MTFAARITPATPLRSKWTGSYGLISCAPRISRINAKNEEVIDYSRTIVTITSNLAGEEVSKMVDGYDEITPELFKEMYELCLEACRNEFTPEFFNRLDDIIMFQPLTRPQIVDVAKLEFVLLEERMHRLKADIRLMVTDPVMEKLVAEGYDIRYGARPLKRLIEANIVTVLPSCMASKQLSKGDRAIISLAGKGKHAKMQFEKVLDE